MGFGGGGFFFLGFLPMPICEEGRGGQCRVGGLRSPAGNAGRRKTHTKIGSTTGGRGSRDARFACRPRVARAGTTVTATSRKRLRSRAGLLDALRHAPRALCVRCRRRCPTASAAAGTPRPWARAREPSARTTRPRSTEPSAYGRNRGRWRGRIRPKPRPPSCVCAAEYSKRGSTTTEAAPTQMFVDCTPSAPAMPRSRDPLAARLGKPSRFREPLARTP